MNILVIYDSFFGNTKKVAEIIAASVQPGNEVKLVNVRDTDINDISGIDMLVVGSPTRKFRPSEGIITFLKNIPGGSLKGVKIAAFDTRISLEDVNSKFLRWMLEFFGYAAAPIAKKMIKKGGEQIIAPEGFYVKDTEGPLKEGENDRASKWMIF